MYHLLLRAKPIISRSVIIYAFSGLIGLWFLSIGQGLVYIYILITIFFRFPAIIERFFGVIVVANGPLTKAKYLNPQAINTISEIFRANI